MSAADTCPVRVYGSHDFQGHRCGKPIKRNGKCGVHAAADERRERNRASWEEKFDANRKQYAEDKQLEQRIAELGGSWPITRAQLIELLERLQAS